MSIWCSWDHIGTETGLMYHVNDDGTTGPQVVHKAERGDVRAYRDGFSNHHPDETDGVATVAIAHIAPWCVPGHDESDCPTCGGGHDWPESGAWIRLDVDSPNALTWWTKDEADRPQKAPVHASVVLDEAAARALAADLLDWADRPHLTAPPPEPAETDASEGGA